MRYKIFPAIGIARLGQDADFIIGQEIPQTGPQELSSDGLTSPCKRFKSADLKKIRKQGIRFRLFQSEDGASWTLANLPVGAKLTWRAKLVNKKTSVVRPGEPPLDHVRPVGDPALAQWTIDGGTREIEGLSKTSQPFVGTINTTVAGAPYAVGVELGHLHTDAMGNLIVTGGSGISGAPQAVPLTGSYYKNPFWHDDVADGPIEAVVTLASGEAPILAEGGAWVLVAPPDYAPEIECPVTLFDVLRQVGIEHFGATINAVPSFDLDIAPILARVRNLRWVNERAEWSDARLSNPDLRKTDASALVIRSKVADLIKGVETFFEGHTNGAGPQYELRDFQGKHIDSWVAGNFNATPQQIPQEITSDGLTRAALEGSAGQGFCPGIEAGIVLLDPTLYTAPFEFRINHLTVQPGDLTALMAQPWQADFVKCNTNWWPTQRPDIAFTSSTDSDDWIRGANSHTLMIKNSGRLGIVVRQGDGEVFLESERDPSL